LKTSRNDDQMPDTVGSHEARTHLPRLLDRVAKGETITITRRGVPVAVLAPPATAEPTGDVRGALERVSELRRQRQGQGLSIAEIRSLIEEGRR